MDEQPANALKKKDSSIAVALRMQKEQKVDAFVSAGNTGAVMASALFGLGRVKGIRRLRLVQFSRQKTARCYFWMQAQM